MAARLPRLSVPPPSSNTAERPQESPDCGYHMRLDGFARLCHHCTAPWIKHFRKIVCVTRRSATYVMQAQTSRAAGRQTPCPALYTFLFRSRRSAPAGCDCCRISGQGYPTHVTIARRHMSMPGLVRPKKHGKVKSEKDDDEDPEPRCSAA